MFAAAVATDCERPPPVPNASVNLVDDDDTENLVSAVYACAAGYRLLGEAELFCDLDTDEWQGEPPACRAGNYVWLANCGWLFGGNAIAIRCSGE